ncbi:unnamed protein product [Schistosoma margrebowiei]|uniref:Uncharacterized protein n=1 Tax=Schistosoma margrebowiei TaxID=48269 RepID=A0A183LM14_9TREM|nr:unnamed protein product [Schistosoma margrebowiei]
MTNPHPLPGLGTSSKWKSSRRGNVESFTYLGSIINEQGGSDADVKVRIGKAKAAFLQLKNIWNSKQLLTNIKVRIFNTNVKIVSPTVRG